MSTLTKDQQRIRRDLRKGMTGLPDDQIVGNKRGDIGQLLDALDAETERADVEKARADTAEAKLAALNPTT